MSPVPFDPARLARVYVLGLGLSGTAAARLLLARGIAVVAGDRRPAAELDLAGLAAADLALGSEPDRLPDGIDAVIVSPGVGADHPLLAAARRDGIPVAAEVELAAAFARGTLIGITGSNGKSTTTAMTGAMLRAAGFAVEVCGNIGVPLASVAEGADDRFLVVELSSFQLETIHRLRPRAAALLNLSPDHLDRHGSLAGYLEAKRRIFRNQTAEDTAVLNADDPAIAATPVAARRRFFSATGAVADGCRVVADRVVDRDPTHGESELFAVADVPLPGPHNLENAMAAALLARAAGAPAPAIGAALRDFRGLPHRLELAGEHRGVRFYDDSKGTNVGATARSLEGFPDRSVHAILGGRNKGADLAGLRDVASRKLRRAYLIGESAGELAAALSGAVETVETGTLEAAVAAAAAAATAGEVVVLSPACASFDQFRDYRDRGEQFVRFVEEVTGGVAAGGSDG